MRRLVVGLISVQMALIGLSSPARGGEGAVFAGSCAVTLTVGFSPAVGRMPGATTATFASTGTCVVNGAVTALTFRGQLATNSGTGGFGCAAGSMAGTGIFYVALPGFPVWDVEVTAVNTGGAISMVITNLPFFAGAATLLQAPLQTASCATGGSVTSTSWTGALSFEDPTLPA